MRRRHLRLPSSSDEEGEASQPQTLMPPNPVPPVEISDDEFVDVPDDLSSPPAEAPPARRVQDPGSLEMGEEVASPVGPIDQFLRGLGLRLRLEWLESCVAGPGFERLDVAGKAKRCFEQFLVSDMNSSGAGVLPENVHQMHKIELEGPFVLQVDEIANISAPLRERYRDVPAGCKRCLKLSMTDGIQRVFGMEYRPIKELEVLASSGLKVVVRNVHIRRGLLMLVPEVFAVLGGLADDLEAARKRLVAEVNKPPRGKRKRGNIISLATRACLAAWSSNSVASGVHTNSTPQNPNEPQMFDQAASLAATRTVGGSSGVQGFEPVIARNSTEVVAQNVRTLDSDNYSARIEEDSYEEPGYDNTRPVMEANTTLYSASDMEVGYASNVEDAIGEVEHPLILSGEKEIPFTYLASLFAKWATQRVSKPCVQGRIKCVLTGVKGFQFKQRSTYELLVYIDDGSLISEILIDHEVVQKGIGHTPEEVTAALSSTDKKTAVEIRDSMKNFQLFLAKFEGTMLLEMNRNSSRPVALEMEKGISTSDACLLLKRLEKTTQISRGNNPIDISP